MTLRSLAPILAAGLLVSAQLSRADGAPRPRAASRFAKVDGWLGLKWKMSLPQVQAVLKRRGVKAKHEWQRGQFPGGGVRTDNLRFDWKGWKVTASLHQVWLSTISITRSRQTWAAVKLYRRSLVRRYGTPKRFSPLSRIGEYWVLAVWSNKHTTLTLAVFRLGSRYRIIQTYQRR